MEEEEEVMVEAVDGSRWDCEEWMGGWEVGSSIVLLLCDVSCSLCGCRRTDVAPV